MLNDANHRTQTLQKIGSFNCQGILTSESKRQLLADDFERYGLKVLALQETHYKGYGLELIKSSNNKVYNLFYSGNTNKSERGVGILISPSRKVTFTPVNDRICYITTKIESKQTLHIISVYAPTLEQSEKNPEIRECFYDDLQGVLRKFKS